jgi:hypothetical protein
MSKTTRHDPQPARHVDPAGVSVTDAVDLLGELNSKVSSMHEVIVEIVDLVDVLRRSGRVEQIEGLPLDLVLALAHKMTGPDAWILLETGRVLADMPATRRRFRDGHLSWSQVRGIVHRARHIKDRRPASVGRADQADRRSGPGGQDGP